MDWGLMASLSLGVTGDLEIKMCGLGYMAQRSELNRFYRKSWPFRFEAIWLKDSTCEGVIRNSWKQSKLLGSVWSFNRNISSCQVNLRVWN